MPTRPPGSAEPHQPTSSEAAALSARTAYHSTCDGILGAQLASEAAEDAASHDLYRILLVEDNPPLARVFTKILSEYYEVDVAYSGKEALSLWEANYYDAAVIDGHLPDMSGFRVAKKIRPVIVIVSGQAGDHLASLAQGVHANAWLRKPVSSADLLNTLAQALRPPRPRPDSPEPGSSG